MSHASPSDFIRVLFLVFGGYVALTLWVSNIASAFRLKRTGLAVSLLCIPPALLLISPFLSEALRPVIFVVLLALVSIGLVKAMSPGAPAFPLRETKPTLVHLVLISMSAVFLIPFVWMVVCSLKENSQLSKFPPEWIPTLQDTVRYNGHTAGVVEIPVDGKPVMGITFHMDEEGSYIALCPIVIAQGEASVAPDTRQLILKPGEFTQVRHPAPLWKNYPDALRYLPPSSEMGLVNLQNTLIIAILSVVGTVLSSSLVAYGFARTKWPGRDIVFGLLLATMMLPDAVTMMPRFLIFRSLGWVDTLRPLWVPSFFASAFNVFLLRQFFMGIPKELEDAARIDGCSYFRTYWSVMMPLIKPSLAAVTIMTFLGSWKDFMNPLIYISSPEKMPLSYVLQLYNSAHSSNPELLMAATTLVMLPVLLLFFFTQRYFIEGVSLTGLGGR